MTIEHIAIWVQDLEAMRAFYVDVLGGLSGGLYENRATGLRSYFVSFGAGARLELMNRPGLRPAPAAEAAGVAAGASPSAGYAHLAFSLGDRESVDAMVVKLRRVGVIVESDPRMTGDGYWEAVVLDPERNRVELTA